MNKSIIFQYLNYINNPDKYSIPEVDLSIMNQMFEDAGFLDKKFGLSILGLSALLIDEDNCVALLQQSLLQFAVQNTRLKDKNNKD